MRGLLVKPVCRSGLLVNWGPSQLFVSLRLFACMSYVQLVLSLRSQLFELDLFNRLRFACLSGFSMQSIRFAYLLDVFAWFRFPQPSLH